MAMKCTICNHPEAESINFDILGGESLRNIAKRYDVSYSSVNRHKKHIPATLVDAKQAEVVSSADRLLIEITGLQGRARGILDRAEQAGDLPTALKAIREARQCLELLAKLEGQLFERAKIEVQAEHEVRPSNDIARQIIADPEASALAHQLLERIANQEG